MAASACADLQRSRLAKPSCRSPPLRGRCPAGQRGVREADIKRLPHPQLLRPLQSPAADASPRRSIPPSAQMLRHQPGELRLRSLVQPRRRLIEQPDRPMADQQLRDRRAPALPGREIAERQMADAAEPDRLQRLVDTQTAPPPLKSRQKRRFSVTSAPSSSHSDGRDSGRPKRPSETPRRRLRAAHRLRPPAAARRRPEQRRFA